MTKEAHIFVAGGRLECSMALGDIRGQMVASFAGSMRKMKKKVMEYSLGEMADNTKAIGEVESNTVRVPY